MDFLNSINKDLFFEILHLGGQNKIIDFLMVMGAQYVIFAIFILILVLVFYGDEKDKKAFILTIISFFVGFVILKLIGTVIFEPRPFQTYHITPLIPYFVDDSFPSDHSLVSSIITFSYLLYRSRYAWVMGLFTVWIGFARVFAGVHYPFDVLGGFGLGLISVALVWYLKNRLFNIQRL